MTYNFSSATNQAGFNILRLINEPSAAVLAYDIGQNDAHYQGYVLSHPAIDK